MPDSRSPPHKKETPFHLPCEFQGKNGRVLYCPECRRLALEYAGCQMVFQRSRSDKLICHLRELLEMLVIAARARFQATIPKYCFSEVRSMNP